MTVEGRHKYRSLSEAGQEKPAKPALGPPHDVWATVLLTLAVAAMLLFQSRGLVGDWVDWTGFLTASAVAVVGIYYFQRAYGLKPFNDNLGHTPISAAAAALIGFLILGTLVGPVVYEHLAEDPLALVASFLSMAILGTGVLRAALGPAPERGTVAKPR